jgi:hypothetical protein
VQGHLIEGQVSVLVKTSCAQTHRPMEIEIDSDLNMNLHDDEAIPLIFSPTIQWAEFKEPNIIHAY